MLKLSDDELARYGEIARDQASAELSRWWVQAVLAFGAVCAFGWAAVRWGIEAAGFGRAVVVAAGVGLLLAYSPYRRVKNWILWRRHCKAVSFEQERRLGAPATRVRVDVAR